jgi:hypothetical protein
MSAKKLFIKYFSFLLDEGFKSKFLQRNSEFEAYYRINSLMIEIYAESQSETLDVILNFNGGRMNLLDCSLIENIERNKVKNQIEGSLDFESKFSILSIFLLKNIKNLILSNAK